MYKIMPTNLKYHSKLEKGIFARYHYNAIMVLCFALRISLQRTENDFIQTAEERHWLLKRILKT